MDEKMNMINSHLIPRGIGDKRVLAAMQAVPREMFVPGHLLINAYDDCALPIGEGQTISQPYMVAVMTQLLNLKGDEKVLEIGTGSGYQAAILSRLAKEIYTIDRIEALTHNAEKIFKRLGYNNITVLTGDGTSGYEDESPYDAIIVTAASPTIPEQLVSQLNDKGRIVIPVGNRWQQILNIATKHGEKVDVLQQVPCVFVPLIGEFGWKSQ